MAELPKKTIIVNSSSVQQGKNSFETGLLLNFNNPKKGGFSIELLMVLDKKEGRSYQRIPLAGNAYLSYLSSLPVPVALVLKKLSDEALVTHLVKNGFAWLRDADKPFDFLDSRHHVLLGELIAGILQELKPLAPALKYLFHLPPGEPFINKNIRPASISAFTPNLSFVLERGNGYLFLRCRVMLNNISFPLEDFEQQHFFLKSGNEYFLLRKEDRDLLRGWEAAGATDELPAGGLVSGPVAPEEELVHFLEKVVKPLAEKYPVDTSQVIRQEIVDSLPVGRVYLSELNENFLLIKPKWLYGDIEVEEWDGPEVRVDKGSAVFTIMRRKEEEEVLAESIRKLHPKFSGQRNGYFYLKFSEALEKNWFVGFYHKMQGLDIPILGMSGLRKFRYNTSPPEFKIIAGKRIDWFDLTIEVRYGGLVVPLHELRKAILGKQEYILLEDGSLGVLPVEWIQKYSLLMKMGKVKEGELKIPGIHWSLVEELDLGGGADRAGIEGRSTLQMELTEKKARLKGIGKSREWPVPAAVQAKLRDYQLAGYQWMCLLDEMGWGGCLANDMGLGKTLQTLCFLQYLTQKYPDETHLVVCPTSLIYNWEAELKKFVPGLAWHVHYGADREFDESVMRAARVIITSYGMVRNDIQHFSGFRFGYIILDESQSIKNPASLVCRAMGMLNGRGRLALSGTPVQNNTFDLYAQMDFLNPGMLGGQDFFRGEFAVPIDKNGDKEAAARLRKLVYPFILRRTKEQVADDLPDKTEMILWCEMGIEQKKIYNSFKEHYRDSILEHISGEGMGKSSIYILEGLTKLRQICDSPAILHEKEVYPNASAKLEELIREIEENTGQHKALVFSQFTSMLRLIREALEQRGLSYVYLDGSVAAGDRRKAVQQFQENDSVRVFLISLKAGGVGLTLTAADYVYLVDPWWNPAVEQQAIDRSHRIGQTNKVFAYRMICKDTVEEKILQLQEKKRSLAADLVGDEAGFVKKLTEEDVVYLFS
ncbi:MAG TPA: DEAD/DEAH box helicase [Puia sp.]|nr:DEAD/DEAH box helicase [Puia sp.]